MEGILGKRFKKSEETGYERQELHPGFALFTLHWLWIEQECGNGAEAALEKRRRAAYGIKKLPKAAGGV